MKTLIRNLISQSASPHDISASESSSNVNMLPNINTCDPMVRPLTPLLTPGNDVIGDQVLSPTLFTSHELRKEPSYPPQTRFI